MSASSWGCELKYQRKWIISCRYCQPLREAVSWNDLWHENFHNLSVSLFVRLWVEIILLVWFRKRLPWSASSWGCELKYRVETLMRARKSSASSWGCELKYYVDPNESDFARSASSWGCELKCPTVFCWVCAIIVSLFVRLWVEILMDSESEKFYIVSLFVRLWVEICRTERHGAGHWVSLFVRLWVEMIRRRLFWQMTDCQPLREAVSWNAEECLLSEERWPSASSWGCELKYT